MRRAAPPMERRGASRSRAGTAARLGSGPSASPGSATAAASRRASVFGNMERGVHATMGGTACTCRLSAWFSRHPSAAAPAAGSASLGAAGASRTGPPAATSCWAPTATGSEEVRGRPRGVEAPLLPSDDRRLGGCEAKDPSIGSPAKRAPWESGSVHKNAAGHVPSVECEAQLGSGQPSDGTSACSSCCRHPALRTHLVCTLLPPPLACPAAACCGRAASAPPVLPPATRGRRRQTGCAPPPAFRPVHLQPQPAPPALSHPAAARTLLDPNPPPRAAGTQLLTGAGGRCGRCTPPSTAWAAGGGWGRPPAWHVHRHRLPLTPPAGKEHGRLGGWKACRHTWPCVSQGSAHSLQYINASYAAPADSCTTTHMDAHGQRLEHHRQQVDRQRLKPSTARCGQLADSMARLPGHRRTPLQHLQQGEGAGMSR